VHLRNISARRQCVAEQYTSDKKQDVWNKAENYTYEKRPQT
jgi:hypothetical protein